MLQVSTSQATILTISRVDSFIYTKASLVFVDCTGVPEQEEDCNPAKNQGVEPERYNKSGFSLSDLEGQAHSS